jgi:hypothetical protein
VYVCSPLRKGWAVRLWWAGCYNDKEAIKDKMRDDHLYLILDKDTWMIDIIRAIRKMPLDH